VLQFIDVVLRRGERTLFDGLSLTIHAGHKAGVVGRNGIGKSTLSARMTSNEAREGVVNFTVNGRDAGQVEIADITGIGVRGGADVGADNYSPVSDTYAAPFEFTGTIHVVDVKIEPKVKLPRTMTLEEASEAG